MKGCATLIAAVVLSLSPSLLRTSEAQQNQPIYPVYDGYVKNADGS